jgi:hypothetical protein
MPDMLTTFYKIKMYFFIHIIGVNVILVASQISLGSLLLVNNPVYLANVNYHSLIDLIQLDLI